MTEPLADPFPDRGHEALRQELRRAIANVSDAQVDREDIRRLLTNARDAITATRADVRALTDRVAALELRLPPL